jgi:hypothetical protein
MREGVWGARSFFIASAVPSRAVQGRLECDQAAINEPRCGASLSMPAVGSFRARSEVRKARTASMPAHAINASDQRPAAHRRGAERPGDAGTPHASDAINACLQSRRHEQTHPALAAPHRSE